MNSFVMFAVFALAAVTNAEAPGGYNYNRPSFASGSSAGGSSFGGSSAISSGGNYQEEAIGASTQEGLNVDPQLLDKIRQILLKEESQNGGGNGGRGGFGGGQPSSQYGAPQQQYGPPQQSSGRVVGIVLENVIPSMHIAQYRAGQSGSAGGYSSGSAGGYPSGPSSFGGFAPQVNAPSSNYGAPF